MQTGGGDWMDARGISRIFSEDIWVIKASTFMEVVKQWRAFLNKTFSKKELSQTA